MVEGVDAPLDTFGIAVDDQVHSQPGGGVVTELVHRTELPGGVDVDERKGRA